MYYDKENLFNSPITRVSKGPGVGGKGKAVSFPLTPNREKTFLLCIPGCMEEIVSNSSTSKSECPGITEMSSILSESLLNSAPLMPETRKELRLDKSIELQE